MNDGTSNRRSGGLLYGFSVERSADCILKVTMLRERPLLANREIAVVDPTVKQFMKASALYDE
jgi:hypothetical protein